MGKKHEGWLQMKNGRRRMCYPFEDMRIGDWLEVHPIDRSWEQVRSAMYQAAHHLCRSGHFKMRPRSKERNAMIVVDCVNERTETVFAESKRLNIERDARLRAKAEEIAERNRRRVEMLS